MTATKKAPAKSKKTEVTTVEIPGTNVVPLQNTPDMLLAKAIEMGGSLEQLEKLMELREKWLARRAREQYFEAFSRFQSMVPDLFKTKQVSYAHKSGGGKTEYKYQELGDIAKHIRDALSQCGLSYKWEQTESNGEITVTCIVSHSGGHVERGQPLSGRADDSGNKNLIQQKASTITYLRRYTLTGILGLSSTEHDDDGVGGAKADVMEMNLPAMDDSQLGNAVNKIMSGEWTIGMVKEKVTVKPDQMKALEKAQQSYMDKMPKPKE